MMDMVERARLNDEAVLREVKRWYSEGNLAEVQAIIDANKDLAERIWALVTELASQEMEAARNRSFELFGDDWTEVKYARN